jgi:hypothetical protein
MGTSYGRQKSATATTVDHFEMQRIQFLSQFFSTCRGWKSGTEVGPEQSQPAGLKSRTLFFILEALAGSWFQRVDVIYASQIQSGVTVVEYGYGFASTRCPLCLLRYSWTSSNRRQPWPLSCCGSFAATCRPYYNSHNNSLRF